MSETSGLTTRLAGWVLDSPRWKYLTVLFVVMFLKTGLTFVAPALVVIAQHPFENPFENPYEHYLYWSWLGPYLAHLIGATTPVTFTVFYLVFSVLFTALMVNWFFTRLDEHHARVAVLLFALLPMSATSYYWIFTDSLTLFLLACTLYFPRQHVVVFLIGVCLGMQHAEQAAFGAAAATFVLAWTGRRGGTTAYHWTWALALLVGVIAGRIALMMIFAHLDVRVNSGRWYWLVKAWQVMLRRFLYSYHVAIFSAFGVGWLVMLQFVRRRTAGALPVAVALLGVLLLMPISDDPTRVFAIVSFPVLCACVLIDREFLATLKRETIGLLLLLWLLVPWTFVWKGKSLVSAAAYDTYLALHHLIDAPHNPKDPRFF